MVEFTDGKVVQFPGRLVTFTKMEQRLDVIIGLILKISPNGVKV